MSPATSAKFKRIFLASKMPVQVCSREHIKRFGASAENLKTRKNHNEKYRNDSDPIVSQRWHLNGGRHSFLPFSTHYACSCAASLRPPLHQFVITIMMMFRCWLMKKMVFLKMRAHSRMFESAHTQMWKTNRTNRCGESSNYYFIYYLFTFFRFVCFWINTQYSDSDVRTGNSRRN